MKSSCSAYNEVQLEVVRLVTAVCGRWNDGCCGLGSGRREGVSKLIWILLLYLLKYIECRT